MKINFFSEKLLYFEENTQWGRDHNHFSLFFLSLSLFLKKTTIDTTDSPFRVGIYYPFIMITFHGMISKYSSSYNNIYNIPWDKK